MKLPPSCDRHFENHKNFEYALLVDSHCVSHESALCYVFITKYHATLLHLQGL